MKPHCLWFIHLDWCLPKPALDKEGTDVEIMIGFYLLTHSAAYRSGWISMKYKYSLKEGGYKHIPYCLIITIIVLTLIRTTYVLLHDKF